LNRREAKKLAETLAAENARARKGMRIQGHPKPYFLSHLLRDDQEWRVEAKFGALTVDFHEQRRNCLADVRVGSYRSDQVRGGALGDNATDVESYDMLRMPIGGSQDGLRHALWRLTEARYRESIDDLLHRQAIDLSYVDEHSALASLERQKPRVDHSPTDLPEVDVAWARDFVEKGSSVFRRYPLLRDGAVRFGAVNSTRVFVSSEGVSLIQSQPLRTVEIYAWYLSPEGYGIPHTRSWLVTDPSELPDLAQVKREVARIHARLEALSKAPRIRSYSGPVLLDPKPAGLLMHEAIGHRLEGNRLLSSGEGQTFKDAVGELVLPAGVSLHDDPSLERFEGKSLAGHYAYDDEGVPAQDARLIEDGVLQGFLTSRLPIGKRHKSNGHARSAYHARAMSRMGVTMVESTDGLSDAEMKLAFLEEIKRQGVPYGVRIVDAYGGETSTDSYNFQAFLGDIDLATRVYPDGREELVRGVDFVGTPLNAIRGIVAAGERHEVDNGFCGAESGYVPVSTISPALLFEELELQQKPSRPLTQFAYPMPWEK